MGCNACLINRNLDMHYMNTDKLMSPQNCGKGGDFIHHQYTRYIYKYVSVSIFYVLRIILFMLRRKARKGGSTSIDTRCQSLKYVCFVPGQHLLVQNYYKPVNLGPFWSLSFGAYSHNYLECIIVVLTIVDTLFSGSRENLSMIHFKYLISSTNVRATHICSVMSR